MACIRWIVIENFRGIKHLSWKPGPGMNCLIGPGDSSKSTVLDAIDLCLGARRNVHFFDTDFHGMDTSNPISIHLILGDLPDELLSIDAYGIFIKGYDIDKGELYDEPAVNLEPVLQVSLVVENDLEPLWTIHSKRSNAEGIVRNLSWKEKVMLAPTRIGTSSDYNLSWQRGSILNKLTEERADASAALIQAGRDARQAFGAQANLQLEEALNIVTTTANELGVYVGKNAQALLDSHSISFGSGTISLHNEDGIPLKRMGVGSSRLLISGLQRRTIQGSTIVLADELEFGLEPHRIVSLLRSLGSKDTDSQRQVFATTHSPIALRELSGLQTVVIRPQGETHFIEPIGESDSLQGTIRLFPEAFLAKSVIVCEGATEVGFLRGLDLYRADKGELSLTALGASLVNAGGGHPDKSYERAIAFQKLGYRVMVVRDADIQPDTALEASFNQQGGMVIHWQPPFFLEQELFNSLPASTCIDLLNFAIQIHEELVDEHLRTVSHGSIQSQNIIDEYQATGAFSQITRDYLGRASNQKRGWFKTIGTMEEATRAIIGPALNKSAPGFLSSINSLSQWVEAGCD
ncbi:ATP-dependent nuclease [Alcanivorax jadensis]|uniref:ATP-dependent nuclease n=1 Tax=Alcanivorax jadensis TaxID=64988 RepID=UPI00240A495D|nr:ATP-binding protein [Alcanivorax jadensis]MDF1638117.1 ATP-binding protein [Alcanivorax jadensis]